MIPAAARVVLLGAGLAFASAVAAAPEPCNKCEDLCQLMDQYLEKEKQIELYGKYAESNPNRRSPPSGTSVGDAVLEEYAQWAKTRELPCEMSLGVKLLNKLSSGGKPQVDLETHIDDPSCKITFGKDKLEDGDTRDRFYASKNCDPAAEATIEHEKVHQAFCLDEYAKNPATAASVLWQNEKVAESEVRAHKRHKEVLEKAIRDIVYQQGCGWEPTDNQRLDVGSLPTALQTKKMQERAWLTNKELVEWLPSFGNTLP